MSLEALRTHARAIFQAGLDAADPGEAVRRHVHVEGGVLRAGGGEDRLEDIGAIRLLGMGKASAAMAEPLLELLEGRVAGGVINVKHGHALPLPGIRVNEAAHPVPDQAGVRGTEEILRVAREAGEEDLIVCLLSGGGSALSPAPAPGLTLEDKQEVTRLLLESGATIHEMNAVRKHLSRIKGGRLARAAYPARLLSLILSDVVGDDLHTIASGPTVPDPSTFGDCLRILDRHRIREGIPASARRLLEEGAAGRIPETPKPGDPSLRGARNVVVGSNALAVEAVRAKALELGYHTLILSTVMEGETREVARVHAAVAREIVARGNPVPRPACVISGGETTVTIRGDGRGGRNQEFALAGALGIRGLDGVLLLSGGTDGTDGPTDAAGAFADGGTVERGRARGMDAEDHLARNDAYPFFQALGDLLVTGPTRTNVMDVRLILVD